MQRASYLRLIVLIALNRFFNAEGGICIVLPVRKLIQIKRPPHGGPFSAEGEI